jgi:glycosyltransferase involved in cell wall biosynthesis
MSISTKNEPFVSVLTPVYNGEKFLEECIQSVLNQNYQNLEYVFVNNKSTDDSLQIMEKYAEQDRRIRIHNNEEFLPQMENLNHAFRQISPDSKYCKVVHADDWIFPDCISEMVKLNEAHPTVGIVSAYRIDSSANKASVELDGLPYPSNFNSGKEIARKYLMHGTSYFGSPSSLLIRSDLIRKREKLYEESLLATDTAACIDILQESDFGFVHKVLTFTRYHDMSMTTTHATGNYSFLHARLYARLTYGDHFLTEKEHKQSVGRMVNLFYILLARNMVQNRSIGKFKRQLKILDDLGLEFKSGKFIRKFMREIVLSVFKLMGMELNRRTEEKNWGHKPNLEP